MAIKDILVHLNGAASGQAVVDTAIKLAMAHEARLIGLYAGVPYDMPSYVVAQLPAEVIEAHQAHVKESAKGTSAAFEKACSANGVSFDHRTGDWRDPVDTVVSLHARYADMVIIGKPEADGSDGRGREIADQVVLHAGTPVLIVPAQPATETVGTKVLVGWDGGPYAARAVRDAMPILRKAEVVKVLAVDPKKGTGGLGDLPGADIAQFMASHGVNAEADHRRSGSVDVGDVILNEAADMGADMIVTGGYGHSRLGELLLGGVTDTLMEEMTIPVLMSH